MNAEECMVAVRKVAELSTSANLLNGAQNLNKLEFRNLVATHVNDLNTLWCLLDIHRVRMEKAEAQPDKQGGVIDVGNLTERLDDIEKRLGELETHKAKQGTKFSEMKLDPMSPIGPRPS